MRGPPSPGPARGAETRSGGPVPATGSPSRWGSMVNRSTGSGLGSETQAPSARAAAAATSRSREEGRAISFPRPRRRGGPPQQQEARVLLELARDPPQRPGDRPELGDQTADLRHRLPLETPQR